MMNIVRIASEMSFWLGLILAIVFFPLFYWLYFLATRNIIKFVVLKMDKELTKVKITTINIISILITIFIIALMMFIPNIVLLGTYSSEIYNGLFLLYLLIGYLCFNRVVDIK